MIRSRGIRKPGDRYSRFSGAGGAMCAHGKMWERPTVMISTRNTKATGRNATYPSANRITSRDQRAVVIRCTATNVTRRHRDEREIPPVQMERAPRPVRIDEQVRDEHHRADHRRAHGRGAHTGGVGRAASAASSAREGVWSPSCPLTWFPRLATPGACARIACSESSEPGPR